MAQAKRSSVQHDVKRGSGTMRAVRPEETEEIPEDRDSSPASSEETRSERFRRIAQNRMTTAITSIESLYALANRKNYEYDEEDVAMMLDSLRSTVDGLEKAFQAGGPRRFTFGK